MTIYTFLGFWGVSSRPVAVPTVTAFLLPVGWAITFSVDIKLFLSFLPLISREPRDVCPLLFFSLRDQFDIGPFGTLFRYFSSCAGTPWD